jgi:hypothetical protein
MDAGLTRARANVAAGTRQSWQNFAVSKHRGQQQFARQEKARIPRPFSTLFRVEFLVGDPTI